MSTIADELKKLQELLDSGALSGDEFTLAKRAILDSIQTNTATSRNDQQLTELRLQNDLLRIDQEWQNERDRHKVSYGKDSVPTEPNAFGTVMSLVGGLIAIGFMINWMGPASEINAPVFFQMFGFVIIAMGIGLPIYHVIKYLSYKSAYDDYQRRRSEVLIKLGKNIHDKA